MHERIGLRHGNTARSARERLAFSFRSVVPPLLQIVGALPKDQACAIVSHGAMPYYLFVLHDHFSLTGSIQIYEQPNTRGRGRAGSAAAARGQSATGLLPRAALRQGSARRTAHAPGGAQPGEGAPEEYRR